MKFKLKIEKVIGGYILTVEKPDGVERSVIGLDQPILTTYGVINHLDKAVGYTILNMIDFKPTDNHVVLNIESYGDVEQDGVEPPSEASEWSLEDYEWKPTEDQMQELYKMVCECRPADQQLLQDLYYGLRSLL